MGSHAEESVRRRWAELFRRLEYGTAKKAVKWKTTSSETDFFSKIGETVLYFGNEQRGGTEYYYVRIETTEGQPIEAFDDEDLSLLADGENYFLRMKEMFLFINRELSGADKYLEDLIDLLPDPDEEIPF